MERTKTMEFKTIKAGMDEVRGRLQNFDPDDAFWMELIERHPAFFDKIGCGVRRFYVTRNPRNKKALELNIERVDGSTTDISWHTCVRGKRNTTTANLKQAMRYAVREQIKQAKEKFKGKPCVMCGQPNEHIDHQSPTFDELVEMFLDQTTYKIPTRFDDVPVLNNPQFKIDDHWFQDEWEKFHLDKAVLRPLCAKCNLSSAKIENKLMEW